MWGQDTITDTMRTKLRIIPTRVGTRCYQTRFCLRQKDHPHACGDKVKSNREFAAIGGSSPRVWGQELSVAFDVSKNRIIPTRVGTSNDDAPFYFDFQDHPHACGDKYSWQKVKKKNKGSSPRVWGQVTERGGAPVVFRIIPTRVGTSILFCRVCESF